MSVCNCLLAGRARVCTKLSLHIHFSSTSKRFKTYKIFNTTCQVFYLPENFIFFVISFVLTNEGTCVCGAPFVSKLILAVDCHTVV